LFYLRNRKRRKEVTRKVEMSLIYGVFHEVLIVNKNS